jgi:hypothetical protein
MTPNGQAAMQSRQPLQVSDWITTVSNSVRMMALVGHTSRHAVFADVAHEEPAPVFAVFGELLDEFYVAPVNTVQAPCIIVAVAAKRIEAAVGAWELVPFFASHLACFAADTDSGVSVKSHWLSHKSS